MWDGCGMNVGNGIPRPAGHSVAVSWVSVSFGQKFRQEFPPVPNGFVGRLWRGLQEQFASLCASTACFSDTDRVC